MTLDFADITSISSEDLVDQPITELPPEVNLEPPTEKVKSWFAPTGEKEMIPCPVCAKLVSPKGMGAHKRWAHGKDKTETATPVAPEVMKKATRERKPSTAGKTAAPKRASGAELISLLFGGVGWAMAASGVSVPTGMAIKMEAGLLGPALDKLAAGTIVDKMAIQPIVKAKTGFEDIAPLVMFPAAVFALDKNPAMYPAIYPMLRATMMQLLPQLVAAQRKAQAEEEKMADAARELGIEGDDPIDELIRSLFPVPMEPVVDEPGSAWQPE